MTTALRIELRKLTTTRSWWLLGLGALALAVVITALTVAGADPSRHRPLDVFTGALTGSVQSSYLLSALVGITSVAGEYRHRTVTSSYLAVPHRSSLISAKLLVLLAYGTAVGLLAMAVCSAIAAPWLAHRGLLHHSLDAGGVARAVIGGTVAIAIVTALGVAVATLVHNQFAAAGGLLVYLFAVEPLINNADATRPAYPFLPGGAVQALAYSGHRAFGNDTGARLLSPWLGAAVLAGYALALTTIAVRTTIRRDIT